MRPLLLSTRSKKGWIRVGKNIRYYYSAMNNNNTNSTYSTNFQAPGSTGTGLPHNGSTQPCSGRKENKDSHKESHPTHTTHSTHTHSASSGTETSNSTSSRHPPTAKPGSFVLSFQHTFEFSDDVCYFAYCLPYTYTDLLRYLAAVRY